MTKNYYDYATLNAAATKTNATETDKLNLLSWFEVNDSSSWNGECYDLGNGLGLYPIYDLVDEENEIFEIVGAEIK